MPISEGMKSIVFLYAGFENTHAFDALFSSQSAFDRVLVWADKIKDVCGIVVAVCGKTYACVSESIEKSGVKAQIIKRDDWSLGNLLEQMAASCSKNGASSVIFSMADRPFLDSTLTDQILCEHEKYLSEYTFADGYPLGFFPEVVDSGTLNILSSLSKDKKLSDSPVDSGSIYSVIKTDINSFEIEAVIAPRDFRMLRLDFSCSSKAKLLSCKALFEEALNAKIPFDSLSLSELAEKTASVQQTVPAFYNVQICGKYSSSAIYNPLFASDKKLYEKSSSNVMSLEQFRALVSSASDFSESAVIGLGFWGDPILLPNLSDYVQAVLANPGLSVLIETDGHAVDENLAAKIKSVAESLCGSEKSGGKITWIVNVDSASAKKYGQIHGNLEGKSFESTGESETYFARSVNSVSTLEKYFPGDVYPQFVRMKINEDELETFYRFWHGSESPSGGKVIIQKYDSFCGLLSDEKPADLSPLKRIPCWHIKRDMNVLSDGSVPMCRECVYSNIVGNVFSEGIEQVWKKTRDFVRNHIECKFDEKCGACDEYYTYNF